jgi:cell division protein FtsA
MAKQKIIAGIDAGSSKIATVIASVVEEEEEVRILGSSSINSRGIRKGQIVNIEEASDAIVDSVEAAERMAGYSLTHVFVCVGGQHIASQNSKGVVAVAEPEGEITQEDVRRVIEAAKAISLPSSREIIDVVTRDFTVDGQEGVADPIGMSGVRLEAEAHIITGATTAIKNLTKCVSELGANISGLMATGMASAEAVLTETEKELGVVLVDLGGGTTSIAIFIEGSPVYASVLPVGARNITNDLAIGLRVPLEAAEKIKIFLSKLKEGKGARPEKSGQEEKEDSDKEEEKEKRKEDEFDLAAAGVTSDSKKVSRKTLIEGIIRPRLNEIFNLVGLEIKKSGFGGMTPSGIVICGGGALTVGMIDSARRTLSLPVRVGSPEGITGLVDDILSPEFAAVTGLVKYTFKKGPIPGKGSSLNMIGGVLGKIPVRGLVERTIDLVKSILP